MRRSFRGIGIVLFMMVFGMADPAFCGEKQVVGGFVSGVTSGVLPLSNVPSDCQEALISVRGGTIAWRMDGTDPTAVEGMLLSEGSYMRLENNDEVAKFRAILNTGSSGVSLYATYEATR